MKTLRYKIIPHISHYENLPQGWAICKVSDVFNVIMGQSPKGTSINKEKGVEFHQGKVYFSDRYLSESEYKTSEPTKIAPKDSILGCVRAPVGVFNISRKEICIGRGLCSIVPRDKKICPLYWQFYFSSLKTYFESKATGTTFKAISGDIIRDAPILLPSITEQARILEAINAIWSVLDIIKSYTDRYFFNQPQ